MQIPSTYFSDFSTPLQLIISFYSKHISFIDYIYIKRVFFQFSAQQALEKIDRTRGHAAHLFATLVTSKDVQYIPHKDQVLQCFPEKIRQSGSDFDEFGWSVESQTFPIFAKLLRLKSYTKATLLGLYHVCTYI